ncbi:MAG: beta-glucosidase [Glaciecola sp.]|jgi:beta-glucosidase
MKIKALVLLNCIALMLSCSNESQTIEPASKEKSKIDLQVDSLLNIMSIEEKVGQMTQVNISVLAKQYNATDIPVGEHALDPGKLKKVLVDCNVGSVLNALEGRKSMEGWHEVINDIQKTAVENTPHHIPVLFGVDAIHGATYIFGSTLFPHNIGISASRNTAHATNCSRVTAMETRASGVRWNFDPVFDIGREPLWPRFSETYGEDVNLCTAFGVAAVKGYEGDDVSKIQNVASCMKHYVGYSKPSTGWDRTPALIPNIELREYYLPQFKAAIEAGAKTIMINSGEVNGVPTHVNEYLLKDVLRDEFGFEGLAVSDWEDIIMLQTKHKVAKTQKEAVKMAVMAGIDMSMVPLNLSFYHLLLELVKEKEVPMTRIDEAVGRILKLKFELGLFENAFPEKEALAQFKKAEYKQLSLDAALESMTLLKNEESLLPLSKSSKVFVAGAGANSKAALHGSWSYSWQGDEEFRYPETTNTFLDEMKSYLGESQVNSNSTSNYDSLVNYSLKGAESADVIVLCLGENAYAETPGSIKDLGIDEKQIDLIERAKKLNKPIVVVLLEGRPRIIRKIVPHANAILMAYLPGEMGGSAITKTLFGENNPSGKLPFTYPRSSAHRVLYDCKYSEMGIEKTQDGFTYSGYNPEYAFGHGLSYTSFDYSNLSISQDTINETETLMVTVTVKNTGKVDGKEAIDLFVRDHYASITPSYKRLKKFSKTSLKSGESKDVSFTLTSTDLEFVGLDLKRITEEGVFSVMIEKLEKEFYLKK